MTARFLVSLAGFFALLLSGCTLVVGNRMECDPADDRCPPGSRCEGGECVAAATDGDSDADAENDVEAEPEGDADADQDFDWEAEDDSEWDAEADADEEVVLPECEEGLIIPCGHSLGTCEPGEQLCEGGFWGECLGGIEPGTEICDDDFLDEDCDGLFNNGCICPEGSTLGCGTDLGLCEFGLQNCGADGLWGACEGSVRPTEEMCNDEDDDCDGFIDNGENACGGICELTHGPGAACDGPDSDRCADDVYECTDLNETVCSFGADSIETCNDRDDNCDGTIDEGVNACGGACPLPDSPGTACDGPDTDLCRDDVFECSGLNATVCSRGGDNEEECDGVLDDDCDGIIDQGCICAEGLTLACGDDTGRCELGVQTCRGETWGPCEGAVGPAIETCNGQDDDCDGTIDNGANACGGACSLVNAPGATCDGSDPDRCTDDFYECEGRNETVCSTGADNAETCNRLDDDCDGVVDEGSNACGGACELANAPGGECDGPDADRCLDDEYECSGLNATVCSTGADNPESCNSIDDDCDGSTDEGSNACGGVCALANAPGTDCDGPDADRCLDDEYECDGINATICSTGADNEEVCNDIDDDCDGGLDEGSNACGGICELTPAPGGDCDGPDADRCLDDEYECDGLNDTVCSAGADTAEACNRADDDCDGTTDEGCAPPADVTARFPWNGYTTGSVWATDDDLTVLPRRPRFIWNVVAAATDYELQIDNSCTTPGFVTCAFPSPEVSEIVADTTFTPDSDLPVSELQPVGRRYYWRVRACRGTACSAWSRIRYVDVGRQSQDFNGDGYADVLVGAYQQDNGAENEGNAYVYYGSTSGISDSPSRTIDNPANQVNGHFGGSIASAGDLNSDGYSDVIVGAYHQSNGAVGEGNAFVYYGSITGIPDTPSSTLDNPTNQGGQFGYSVSSAGDVNGDGYTDIIVGARTQENGAVSEGNAFVYHGSSMGVSPTPTVNLDNPANQVSGLFGSSVASAGDVNGDGFADIIVGALSQDNGAEDEGNAFVFYGSTTGVPDRPSRTFDNPTNQRNGEFGGSVASAGDTNGDGFSDIIVGAQSQDNGAVFEGNSFVYHGSLTGLPGSPTRTLENPDNQEGGKFGIAVMSAGDLNNDGFTDVVVGAHMQDDEAINEGKAFVYHGSTLGIPDTPSRTIENPAPQADGHFGYSVSSAGDIDGNGFAEVIIGARDQDNGSLNEGNAFIYNGSATGINDVPSRLLDNPTNQIHGNFGNSVASATRRGSGPPGRIQVVLSEVAWLPRRRWGMVVG
jgi:hypothetical protein